MECDGGDGEVTVNATGGDGECHLEVTEDDRNVTEVAVNARRTNATEVTVRWWDSEECDGGDGECNGGRAVNELEAVVLLMVNVTEVMVNVTGR